MHHTRLLLRLAGAAAFLLLATGAALAQNVDPALRQALHDAVTAEDHGFADRFEAEVWLTDMSTRLADRLPDLETRLALLRTVHREATRAGLAPELVLAVIEVESAFDRYALSSAGARGLMQVMPFWLEEIGRPGDNLFDVQTNLRYGCTILRLYLDREQGALPPALARYNGSYGTTWYAQRVLGRLAERWYRQ